MSYKVYATNDGVGMTETFKYWYFAKKAIRSALKAGMKVEVRNTPLKPTK